MTNDVDVAAAKHVAKWAGLPCDDERAARLAPFFAEQKARMARFYAEDVSGLEFDFLSPRQ